MRKFYYNFKVKQDRIEIKKKSFGEVNFDEVSQPFWKRFIEVVCVLKSSWK
jgi:hypothetical protein